jgi:hypothetical protein
LTAEIRRPHPSAGILADPDAANTASRRVLEKNGFRLVAVKPVATDAPMAIYRLPPARYPANSRLQQNKHSDTRHLARHVPKMILTTYKIDAHPSVTR